MTWITFASALEAGARLLVLAAFAGATLVAATHWAVRARRLQPFGPLPRTVRRWSDPLLLPLERRLVRTGRNPQNAPAWLLGITVVAGIVLLSLLGWLTGWIGQLLWLRTAGATAWVRFLVGSVTQVIMLAILVRVIGSWVGASRYTPWMKPVVWLTDWIIEPIRRRLPPTGMLDLSPLVAYFALLLLRGILLSLLS